jgi:anthranilate phosphoribosyltransferase
MVCHGLESLDEISVAGPTLIGELKDNEVREYQIKPADFGLDTHDAASIRVDGAEQSKAMLLEALDNKAGAARDIVALNAGASVYVAGLADTHAGGVRIALAVMASGVARKKLDQFVAFTRAVK